MYVCANACVRARVMVDAESESLDWQQGCRAMYMCVSANACVHVRMIADAGGESRGWTGGEQSDVYVRVCECMCACACECDS